MALEPPTLADISASMGSAFIRDICESLSRVCVNSFILISGWYSIKFKFDRLIEIVFQTLFISLLLFFFMRLFRLTEPMNARGWIELFIIKNGSYYWFVRSYLILYIFAPVLNAFVDNCEKKQIMIFLIFFYCIQITYGFYESVGWFSGGFSPLSFMGLYILARFIRLYSNRCTQFNMIVDISIYVAISILSAIISLAITFYFGKGGTVLFLYSSPLIIASSVFYFLFFTKLSFSNKIVNWISVSCFAVYLFHTSPFIFHPFYIDPIRHRFETESSVVFILFTLGLIISVFVISILLDKVRIIIWRFLSLYLTKFYYQIKGFHQLN